MVHMPGELGVGMVMLAGLDLVDLVVSTPTCNKPPDEFKRALAVHSLHIAFQPSLNNRTLLPYSQTMEHALGSMVRCVPAGPGAA